MPTSAEARTYPAPPTTVQLELGLRVGVQQAAIVLDAGHCERLIRMATYVALRDAALGPDEAVHARLVAGHARAWHDEVSCLESCAVELADAEDRVITRVEFPRRAFAAFALARATHLLAVADASGADTAATGAASSGAEADVVYWLHGRAGAEGPVAITLPNFAPFSLRTLIARADAEGDPDGSWIATVVTRSALDGLAELEHLSRERGVETAARIQTRIGFDPARRCFIRVLEAVAIDAGTQATATSVISSAASWAALIADGAVEPRAPSSAHTHLHLAERRPDREDTAGLGAPAAAAGVGPPAPTGPVSESLDRSQAPCISNVDVVTHFVTYPDPLSALAIVSLFPDRSVLKIYGYTPDALLREEPGYWVLPTRSASTPEPHRRRSRRRTPARRPKGDA